MRIVTFSFDDGFRRSFQRTAEIFEARGLSCSLNVMADESADLTSMDKSLAGLGDFGLWNELAARGHEIMPHSLRHENLAKLDFEDGKGRILRCLDVFEEKLAGFRRADAIFHYPFNASTPALDAWLSTVIRAYRNGYEGFQPLPTRATVRITATSHGPENCEPHLEDCIEKLLAMPEGWLFYNTPGIDGEGWGPIGGDYLSRLLDRLLAMKEMKVLTPAQALDTATRGLQAHPVNRIAK